MLYFCSKKNTGHCDLVVKALGSAAEGIAFESLPDHDIMSLGKISTIYFVLVGLVLVTLTISLVVVENLWDKSPHINIFSESVHPQVSQKIGHFRLYISE